jgi:transposase
MIKALAKRCAGMDVHKKIIVCTMLCENEDGTINKDTREYKTFHSELEELAKWLKEREVELTAMESTGVYWKGIYEILEDNGIKTFVVNARHIKNVPGRKTDIQDSEWLAELARCGLLRGSFIPPKDLRQLRLLTRYRRKLSGYLSSEKNRLHKILEDGGIKLSCVVSSIDGVSAKKMIEALVEGIISPDEISELAKGRLNAKKADIIKALEGNISDRHRFLLKRIQSHINWLDNQIKEIDSQVVAAMEPYKKEWQVIQTIPGIDEISAAILLSEIGTDMNHFGSKDRLSSWAGVCPGNNESAGKKKSGHICKGNTYVRQLLCEIANSAVKTNSQFKNFYKGLLIRRGHKRAIIAVGHKILGIIFTILKKKEVYKDSTIDYEAMLVKKNAPRWIKSLQKFGYLPISK